MKYRELVVVLCLVAVACVWWGWRVSEPGSSTITPLPSGTGVPNGLSDKSQVEEHRKTTKEPILRLTLLERGTRLEEIVIGAKLETNVQTRIPLTETGEPYVFIHMGLDSTLWHWKPKSKKSKKNKILKPKEQMVWEIPMNTMTLIDKDPEVRNAASKAFEIEANLIEAGSAEPNPFARGSLHVMRGELAVPAENTR